jgi:DNA-binding MarR family transcriptional regulator
MKRIPDSAFVKFPFSVLRDSRMLSDKSRLSINDMRVLAVLIYRSHLDKNNECWPSKKDLAFQTGIPEKKISGYTKRLEKFGWIEKLSSKGGSKNTQKYHVLTSPKMGPVKLAPRWGVNQPQDGVVTSPDLGPVTPINKREKEREFERGNKNGKYFDFNSRKYSEADIKKSKARLKRLLKMEKQQENAIV